MATAVGKRLHHSGCLSESAAIKFILLLLSLFYVHFVNNFTSSLPTTLNTVAPVKEKAMEVLDSLV